MQPVPRNKVWITTMDKKYEIIRTYTSELIKACFEKRAPYPIPEGITAAELLDIVYHFRRMSEFKEFVGGIGVSAVIAFLLAVALTLVNNRVKKEDWEDAPAEGEGDAKEQTGEESLLDQWAKDDTPVFRDKDK